MRINKTSIRQSCERGKKRCFNGARALFSSLHIRFCAARPLGQLRSRVRCFASHSRKRPRFLFDSFVVQRAHHLRFTRSSYYRHFFKPIYTGLCFFLSSNAFSTANEELLMALQKLVQPIDNNTYGWKWNLFANIQVQRTRKKMKYNLFIYLLKLNNRQCAQIHTWIMIGIHHNITVSSLVHYKKRKKREIDSIYQL